MLIVRRAGLPSYYNRRCRDWGRQLCRYWKRNINTWKKVHDRASRVIAHRSLVFFFQILRANVHIICAVHLVYIRIHTQLSREKTFMLSLSSALYCCNRRAKLRVLHSTSCLFAPWRNSRAPLQESFHCIYIYTYYLSFDFFNSNCAVVSYCV